MEYLIQYILIFLVVAYFVKTIVSDLMNTPFKPAQATEPPVQTEFTPQTLAKYNGLDGNAVYLAVKGKVFDVSAGKAFYGPGGPYENFAGRDASRGLALNSFDPSVLTALSEPIDSLSDLSTEEKESLDNWESHFENKYKVVGTLHNPTKA